MAAASRSPWPADIGRHQRSVISTRGLRIETVGGRGWAACDPAGWAGGHADGRRARRVRGRRAGMDHRPDAVARAAMAFRPRLRSVCTEQGSLGQCRTAPVPAASRHPADGSVVSAAGVSRYPARFVLSSITAWLMLIISRVFPVWVAMAQMERTGRRRGGAELSFILSRTRSRSRRWNNG